MHLVYSRTLLKLPRHLQLHSLRYATTAANFPGSQDTTTTNNFPYPKHSRPSPYEIFHLPVGSSQKDVKSRYYDLVLLYHPDSAVSRTSGLSKESKEERFRSITNAYDLLRGKKPHASAGWHGGSDMDWDLRDEIERRRRANSYSSGYGRRYTSWSHPYGYHGYGYGDGSAGESSGEWTVSLDHSLKDKVIILIGILCVVVAMAPSAIWSHQRYLEQTHLAASANLAKARREAREFGAERRVEIKKRVQNIKEQQKSDSDR